MKNKLLIVAFVAQFLLIGGAFVNAYLPVFFGEQVKLRVRGYDPRDILAGNFVRLNYGLELSIDEYAAMQGKEIYVSISDSNNDGIFEFGKKSPQKPKDGLFIKTKCDYYQLKIGAEKYFAPKERALEIEQKLREMSDESNPKIIAIATLKIYNGKVRLLDLEIVENPKNYLPQ